MKFVNINGPFIEKHLDLLENLKSIFEYNYKKAIDNEDQKAEANFAAALIKIQIEIDKTWKIYNEEIGDGVDWEKIYEEDK